MITGQELLDRLESQFKDSFERRFAFPFTYISIVSSSLPDGEEEREEFIAKVVSLDVPTLRALCNRLFLRIEPRHPGEPDERPPNQGEFWMRALQEEQNYRAIGKGVCAVHFYGFKGGQTRSTLLAFLSMTLALDGWRAIAIDMDAEAPSLDVIYGISATHMAATMLGVRAGLAAQPLRAFTPSSGNGFVDLLPFRPQGALYDLDAAALTMELGIHPPGQQGLIDAVLPIASRYDIVLVDHRTGLAPTILPWVAGLPGPVIVFARMDGQWRGVQRHLLPLWSGYTGQPGLLVSAVPPERDESAFVHEEQDQASELIEELAAAYRTRDDSEEIGATDLLDHWVLWPYAPELVRTPLPEPSAVGGLAQARIADIRRLLELTGQKAHEPFRQKLDPSGARDEGHLIQTKALRQLSTPNNPYTFILGRKGTGKTRLVRALTQSQQGEPLLVASDFSREDGGIVRDTLLDQVAESCAQPEAFWWLLISVGLHEDTENRDAMRRRLKELHDLKKDPIDLARSAAVALTKSRVFFIDGLETSFSRERTFLFLGGLFRVVAAIEADPDFRDRVQLKIFVRTDLAQRGYENFEQQSHGRRLELAWDTQSILNFALSRIERLAWFGENFPDAAVEVRERLHELKEGAVSTEDCDRLLMRYFPHRLGHANINTTTFLRTWFSDDPKAETSFYPRVYDGFLRIIADRDKRSSYAGAELENERLAQALIYYAHSRSTEDFLQEVKSELLNIVDLTESQLTDLLDAMKGTITPFVLEKRVDELAQRSGLTPPLVRQAAERMKRLGIFEDRPKFPGQWRVGRLFKSSLKMIYDRKRRDPTELPD